MSGMRDVSEDETNEVDNQNEIPKNWRLSADARSAIQRGEASGDESERIIGSGATDGGNEVSENETKEVDNQSEIPKNWRLSADARSAIQRGEASGDKSERMVGSRATDEGNEVSKNETGKTLTDDREPGVSTHLHRHEGGVTISVKDQNEGKVERYNFDTGDGFEKTVNGMSSNEAKHRMRSEHTDYNPNPDRDTIPGFHSSVWIKRVIVEDEEV